MLILFSILATKVYAGDTDNDGIDDTIDNCINTPNHEQRDTDGDGYGNRCDGDHNSDCVVNVFDLGLFRSYFNTSGYNGDVNGDGDVDLLDLQMFQKLYLSPLDQCVNGIFTP